MKEIKKAECPMCHQTPKILKRCHCCKQWCCNICSVELLCKDCHNFIYQKKQVDAYFQDKYESELEL